jgi:hypothetical protein
MIIDVQYLHMFAHSRKVYQPRMTAIRDDLRPEACTLSQLRFKSTDITVRRCNLKDFLATIRHNSLPQYMNCCAFLPSAIFA